MCLPAAFSRNLQEAQAQAPTAAEDAIISIMDASGLTSAAIGVADHSTLKVPA